MRDAQWGVARCAAEGRRVGARGGGMQGEGAQHGVTA